MGWRDWVFVYGRDVSVTRRFVMFAVTSLCKSEVADRSLLHIPSLPLDDCLDFLRNRDKTSSSSKENRKKMNNLSLICFPTFSFAVLVLVLVPTSNMPLLRLNTSARPLLPPPAQTRTQAEGTCAGTVAHAGIEATLPSRAAPEAETRSTSVHLMQGPSLYYHYGVDGVDDRVSSG